MGTYSPCEKNVSAGNHSGRPSLIRPIVSFLGLLAVFFTFALSTASPHDIITTPVTWKSSTPVALRVIAKGRLLSP
jgi:hypothetical protein